MITENDIRSVVNACNLAGFTLSTEDLQMIQWEAGVRTHIPTPLPAGNSAVYIFKWQDEYLKVGKVNNKSNARYQSQHYNSASSKSNLSKSIQENPEMMEIVGETNVGDWIKSNTTRFNIHIPSRFGKNIVHFIEAFFILKCNPKFENSRA